MLVCPVNMNQALAVIVNQPVRDAGEIGIPPAAGTLLTEESHFLSRRTSYLEGAPG